MNSVATTFAYNGDGLRDSLTVDSTTSTQTWDVNRGIPQMIGTTEVYGVGRILKNTEPSVEGDTFYYLTDGIGSVLRFGPLEYPDYDVFGAPTGFDVGLGGVPNDFRFAGEQKDPTGLYYLRARYYDPVTGRFLSKDLIPGNASEPASLNPYAYVMNDPLNLIDPLGLHCKAHHPHHCVTEKASDAGDFVSTVYDHPGSVIQQAFGTAVALTSTGTRTERDDVTLYEDCVGTCSFLRLIGPSAITMGHNVFHEGGMSEQLLEHELVHVSQGDEAGLTWLYQYFGESHRKSYNCNRFEIEARRTAGQTILCPGKE